MIAAAVSRTGLRPWAARPNPQSRGARTRGVVRSTLAGNTELFSDRTIRGLLLAQWLPVWLVAAALALRGHLTGRATGPGTRRR